MTERPGQRLIREQRQEREAIQRATDEVEAAAAIEAKAAGDQGMITSYSTSPDDPYLVAVREEARARVALMQIRTERRQKRRREIAVELQTIRARLGLTQHQMAGHAGVPFHVVRDAENSGSIRVDRAEALLEQYRGIATLAGKSRGQEGDPE